MNLDPGEKKGSSNKLYTILLQDLRTHCEFPNKSRSNQKTRRDVSQVKSCPHSSQHNKHSNQLTII